MIGEPNRLVQCLGEVLEEPLAVGLREIRHERHLFEQRARHAGLAGSDRHLHEHLQLSLQQSQLAQVSEGQHGDIFVSTGAHLDNAVGGKFQDPRIAQLRLRDLGRGGTERRWSWTKRVPLANFLTIHSQAITSIWSVDHLG